MGGTRLSYAAESSPEILSQVESENLFVRAFHSIADIITSFLSWSVETFGNVAGRILGWLGVGTPALFILWVIKKIIGFFINKHVVSPFKRAVNKRTVDKYGTNVFKDDIVEVHYKRPLTKQDIVRITRKYGASVKNNETHDYQEVYTEWQYGVATWYFVYFCEDGIHTQKGVWSPETNYMDYNTLREDDTTMSTLKFWFEDYPHEFYNMLMELKEA